VWLRLELVASGPISINTSAEVTLEQCGIWRKVKDAPRILVSRRQIGQLYCLPSEMKRVVNFDLWNRAYEKRFINTTTRRGIDSILDEIARLPFIDP